MKNPVSLLVVVAILSLSQPVQATSFDDAVKAYESEKYEVAFDGFKLLAEIGNKQAQYNLGFMYVDGLGVPQDLVKGYAWIKLSSEEKSEPDELLGKIEEHLSKKQYQEAGSFYENLYKQYSAFQLESNLKPVLTVVNDKVSTKRLTPLEQVAVEYPREASLNGTIGHVVLNYRLDEKGAPYDVQVSESVPRKVFDKVSRRALKQWIFDISEVDLERRYTYRFNFTLHGYKIKKPGSLPRLGKSQLNEIKAKAFEGDAVSQYLYAKYEHRYVNDSINSTEWFHKAAKQGVIEAQYDLGVNLINGKGCEADQAKGIQWLLRSASGNHAKSQLKIAKYYKSLGEEDSFSYWLRKALDAKDKVNSIQVAEYIIENRPKGFTSQDAWEQLNLILPNDKFFSYELYSLYAKVAYEVGEYKTAVKYQEQVNAMLRPRVPEEYSDALDLYEDALEEYEDSRKS